MEFLMTKKELLDGYPGLRRKLLRALINHIIAAHRDISFRAAKWKKHVLPREAEIFRRIVGEPIQDGQSVDEFAPTKKYLVQKYGDRYPKTWIRAEINELLESSRSYPGAKYEKVLFPREYEKLKKLLE